ncbi:MAG: cytochrome P450, partial [Abitibacteriaceae bacterium]|nr:cytochrome P450 [Abditibacteriaceae bacterium]
MTMAPGMVQWLPLPYGTLQEFLHDPLAFQIQGRARCGDVMRLRIGPLLLHFLFHPDHIRRVLFTHQKNYLRGWHYRLLRQLFGDNLLVSEGNHWRRQRRLAQPAFQHQRLAAYAAIMVDATAQLLARWRDAATSGQALEIGPEMAGLALTIAGRTLFDRDVGGEADMVGKSFDVLSQYLRYRFDHPFTALPTSVPTRANRRFQQAATTLNQLVLSLIQERRREGRDHGDLLSMFMQARDEETGEAMTDDQLRSEVLTFLIAGHETTATALTW